MQSASNTKMPTALSVLFTAGSFWLGAPQSVALASVVRIGSPADSRSPIVMINRIAGIVGCADASARWVDYVWLMSREVDALRRLRSNAWAADTALALALTLTAQVEVWLTGSVSADRGVVAAVALVITAAIAWRKRAPVWAAAVVAVAYGVQDLSAGYLDGAISVNVAVVAALYSVAAYEETPRALGGGAMILAAAWLGVAEHSDSTVGDYFFSAAVLGAAWAFGAVMRARRHHALRLEDRASVLERERDEKALVAAEEERARIARELHDVVAHSVGVIVVQAGAERMALGPEAERTRDVLSAIERTGREALAEMRRLLGMLRKDDDGLALTPQPSLSRVDALVRQMAEAGLPVDVEVEGDPVPLAPGIDLSAYRIVQEALTNALKHAGPGRARVVITYRRDEIELEVSDDGGGPALAAAPGGHGLVGMRERVALYGGELESGLGSAGGFVVRARLPFVS
jgi:signal transduction histidine kinase